jgi:hypothetical protein
LIRRIYAGGVLVVEGVRSDVLFRFPFSGVTWTGEPACI